MKSLKYIWILCLSCLAAGLTSCNEEDKYFDSKYQSTKIVVDQIYLEDYESSVPDRPVTFARLGQLIRVEGSGLYGMKKVYINGYETYFNRAYVTDHSMLIQINSNTPVEDAEEADRNKIRFVKDDATLEHPFIIRAASPTITGISNTLPKDKEKVTVYGTGLQETTKVTLPGGIEITDCMILDFDGNGSQGFWSWSETGSMINADDLVEDPYDSGRGKCVQIVPERLLKAGVISGKPRVSECWTAGNDDAADDWSRMYSYIPATTPLTEVALQFDVYVPEAWSGTGHLQISLFNNFNFGGIGSDDDGASNQVAFYVPWIQEGAIVPFSTTGWQTVTIPFSQFNKYATMIEDKESPVFQNVVEDRNAATYRNFGMGFVNTDFTYQDVSITSTAFSSRIYLDNWRVVPYKTVTISDYPEDEETTE